MLPLMVFFKLNFRITLINFFIQIKSIWSSMVEQIAFLIRCVKKSYNENGKLKYPNIFLNFS